MIHNWKEADIKFKVCSNSSEESNLFLRRFYEELFRYEKIGWLFQSYRKNNIIYVGQMNYGDMWISYKEKGKIDSIFIKTHSDKANNLVNEALKNAKDKQKEFKTYTITVIFDTDDIIFYDMRKNGIRIYSEEIDNKVFTKIKFSIKAFGTYDLEYIKTQKVNYLKHLFCSYTNMLFKCIKIEYSEEKLSISDNIWQEPDSNWIDIDELFINKEQRIVSLCTNFFDILLNIIHVFEYDKKLRLLLNASQEIYYSKKMIGNLMNNGKEWNMPCYTDLVNTLMISVLEPLSNIHERKPERCDKCNNLKYSIREKIKNLCNKYFPENITKEIFNDRYNERSSFLHEGNPITNEFYCGHCVPLINPLDGRSIMFPITVVHFNMFDYVTYIFRRVCNDVINESQKR